MKTKTPSALALVLLSGTLHAHALDYFGEIEANTLVLKLDRTEGKQRPTMQEFPAYIVLDHGIPLLVQSLDDPEGRDEGVKGKLRIVNLVTPEIPIDRIPAETRAALLEQLPDAIPPTQVLHFEFRRGGWSSDSFVDLVTIPYTVDTNDELQLLRIADHGTMEMQWHDPKNSYVDVVSYWSGTAPPYPIAVTVLESTLGFGNKLKARHDAGSGEHELPAYAVPDSVSDQ